MNEIVKTFQIAGDKFIPKTNLRQPSKPGKTGITWSACKPNIKTKKEHKTLKEQEFQDTSNKTN